MHNMTERELITRAEQQLGDKIIKVTTTKGHLANDLPNSIVTISRRFDFDSQPISVYEIYQWHNKLQRFAFIREIYREIDCGKKATIKMRRELNCLINELIKVKTYLDNDTLYVSQVIDDVKKQITILQNTII